jgi:hypothetical protein
MFFYRYDGQRADRQQRIGGAHGQLDGSISLFFFSAPNGFLFSIDGLANESMEIGDVSAFGTPDGLQTNNFAKGMDAGGFHLSTPFLLQVMEASLSSPSSEI